MHVHLASGLVEASYRSWCLRTLIGEHEMAKMPLLLLSNQNCQRSFTDRRDKPDGSLHRSHATGSVRHSYLFKLTPELQFANGQRPTRQCFPPGLGCLTSLWP